MNRHRRSVQATVIMFNGSRHKLFNLCLELHGVEGLTAYWPLKQIQSSRGFTRVPIQITFNDVPNTVRSR